MLFCCYPTAINHSRGSQTYDIPSKKNHYNPFECLLYLHSNVNLPTQMVSVKLTPNGVDWLDWLFVKTMLHSCKWVLTWHRRARHLEHLGLHFWCSKKDKKDKVLLPFPAGSELHWHVVHWWVVMDVWTGFQYRSGPFYPHNNWTHLQVIASLARCNKMSLKGLHMAIINSSKDVTPWIQCTLGRACKTA